MRIFSSCARSSGDSALTGEELATEERRRQLIKKYPAANSRRRLEGPSGRMWLTVSPDEEWVLYSELPIGQSELMLVENFR